MPAGQALPVTELSALCSAWVGTYLDPQARVGDGSAWHDILDRTLHRIDAWHRTGCADGTHRPDMPLGDDTDHSHRERAIHADLAGRESQFSGRPGRDGERSAVMPPIPHTPTQTSCSSVPTSRTKETQ